MSEFRASTGETTDSLANLPDAKPTKQPVLAEKAQNAGLYTYKTVHNRPLTVDNFKLNTFWESPTADMRDKIEMVDEWIIEKAKQRNLEDKPESYKEIVDEILNQIGKSDNEKPLATFERLSTAIDAVKRLEEAKLPPVLDVNTLTATEYKKTRL